MKNKTIKKIAKQVYLESQKINSIKESSIISDNSDWCLYDKDVSNKFKKLLFDILGYKDNINLSYSPNSINLRVENIKKIKSTQSSHLVKSNEENYLNIDIERGKGFYLNLGYRKNTRYIDEKMYDEIIDMVKKRVIEINSENFNEIWEVIVKDSGILRDNNLINLLEEKS